MQREEIDYATWYSPWMRRLAETKTRAELERMLGAADVEAKAATAAHERAVKATSGMGHLATARAYGRNRSAAAGDAKIAIRGALEIHALFPEHAKGSDDAA